MEGQSQQGSKTPDDEVADRIAAAIGTAGLVVGEKLGQLKEGLAKGSLSSRDWKVLLELGHPGEGGPGQE